MITTEMKQEFTEYCEKHNIKNASIAIYVPSNLIGYHGYVYGDCVRGGSCYGRTLEEFIADVKNKATTKQARIDSLKQQVKELEAQL